MPEDNEFTISDMVNTVVDGSPTKFADVFSGVMVDRVNDRVDQIRQAVAAKINGDDTSTDPAMEPGVAMVYTRPGFCISITTGSGSQALRFTRV